MEIEGVISRARFQRGHREFTVTDGKNDYPLETREPLMQGMCVRILGELAAGGKVVVTKAEALEGAKAKEAYRRARDNAAAAARLPDAPSLVCDETMKKLWPLLREAAAELAAAKKLGRSVLLRFHGDADGIAGAFALSEVIYCKAFQQNSAAYTAREALRDISMVGQESRPLAVLLDFGSGKNCAEGIGFLAAAGIDCMVIDHHPYEGWAGGGGEGGGSRTLINPFSVAENASGYTAGCLACEVAVALGLPREKALELAKTACSGDKSELLPAGEADRQKALVLDFLASHMSFGNNLDFYRNVMGNPELFGSIMRQADETIKEAADRTMARMKEQAAGRLAIAVFSLEDIAKKDEWPPSSKITTRVFDRLRERDGGALFCIGYTERSVIMRLNDAAVAMGLDANGIAAKLKNSMADFVEGGGGHAKAGAIRVKPGFVKEVVNEVIRAASAAVPGG